MTLPIAHGIAQRADLPITLGLFLFGSVVVLVVSFVALAVLWRRPLLEHYRWRPLPGFLGRLFSSRPVEVLCGAIGVGLLFLVVYAGFKGQQTGASNFAPTFVYVIFWVGLVAASILFGDVYRAFNPWRAIGRAVAFVARLAARGELPPPLEYPKRAGLLACGRRACSPSPRSSWSTRPPTTRPPWRSRRSSTRWRPSSGWRCTGSTRG